MKVEEAIKYLQQLYPNGGHCWLDEQRIEAISMAIKALQEEPASKDLEREIKHYVYDPYFDLNGVAVKGATDYLTVEDVADIARHFAQWQKEQDQSTIELAEDHAYLAGQEKEKNEGMIEALRTEYEKGRADVIADTLSWLENCWPRYCSNQTIIEGFKEAIKE